MNVERIKPMPSANDNSVLPPGHVIAARALRRLPEARPAAVLHDAVDLAKQPGLLYRLQAMLVD